MGLQSKGKTSYETRMQNNEAVRLLVSFLRSIIDNPSPHQDDSDLISQLKRQENLATLKSKSFKMPNISFGTIRNRANDTRDSIIPGGWESIDKLRKAALIALNENRKQAQRPNKQTKAGLVNIHKEDQAEIRQLWDEVAHLTFMFHEAISLAKEFADKCIEPSDKALYVKRLREIMAMFSPLNRPKPNRPE